MVAERGRPLPHGRYILPTLAAFWNRIKGGIDVFSRHLKNVKANHSSLSPYAACWIRLIMAMVYNSHQMYQIMQSYDYLMDKRKCLSFKDYVNHKAKSGCYLIFCKKVAATWEIKANQLSDEEEEEVEQDCVPSPNIKYNKREAFFSVPSLIATRLNPRLPHVRVVLRKRLSCVYCCHKKHEYDANTTGHCRHGHKTTFICKTCEVPLCYNPRFGGDSCAKLFHEVREINDPCEMGTVTSVQSHKNRLPPPCRKRSGDELPNSRSKSNQFDTPMVRRSGRHT
jgi:hypothetical protein